MSHRFECVELVVEMGDLSQLNRLSSGGFRIVFGKPVENDAIWFVLERDVSEIVEIMPQLRRL